MKRGFLMLAGMVLALLLLCNCFTPACAAESDALLDTIEAQISKFVKAYEQPGADKDAATALASHGMFKGGKTLVADDDHSLTATLMGSKQFQKALVYDCTTAIQYLQQSYPTQPLIARGACNWYGTSDSKFTLTKYLSEEFEKEDRDFQMVSEKITAADRNAYDDSLDWMAGGVRMNLTLEWVETTADAMTYNVTCTLSDRFDFSTSSNSGFKNLISGIGALLFREFDWTVTVNFPLTVPYECAHSSGAYHWIYDEESATFSNDATGGFTANDVTARVYTNATTGKVMPYHALSRPVRLYHDEPWVLEYNATKLTSFAMAPFQRIGAGDPYLWMQSGRFAAVRQLEYRVVTEGFKEEHGLKSTFQSINHYYGAHIREQYKYSSKTRYTVRLENLIESDGSNMIYLTLLNRDKGTVEAERVPLDGYFQAMAWKELKVSASKAEDWTDGNDWVSGKDLLINYFGTMNSKFSANALEMWIWENGRGVESKSCFDTETASATCTHEGSTTHTCSVCGYQYTDRYVPATGHSFGSWITQTEATCTDRGIRYRTCGDCGQKETKESPALGHSFGAWKVTANPGCMVDGEESRVCSACGISETKAVLAVGHSAVAIPAVDAACTETGLTEGSVCSVCDEILVIQEVIPATGHSYESVVTTPDCINGGYTTYTCACGDGYISDEQAALGHDVVMDSGMDATCTEDGLTEGAHCGRCGEMLIEQQTIPAVGHNYVNGICACGEVTTYVEAPVIKVSNVASSGKVKVTWEKVDGAESYQVYRATSKNGTYKLMKTVSGTTYTNTTAATGKTYYYYVVAVAADGTTSEPSSLKSRTCDLAQPRVTASNSASNGKVKLTWEKIEGAVSYKVYRSETKDGTYKLMKTVTGTTYTNTSAEAGKTYYYKVKAIAENSAADSADSAIKSRTCDLPQPEVSITRSSGKPKVSWNKVTGAVSYKVYRATSKSGTYSLVKTTTNRSYKDTTAKKNTTCYYKVVAVCQNTAGNSAYSGVVSIKSK